MTDVDAIIRRHQQRLEHHRRELDQPSSGTATPQQLHESSVPNERSGSAARPTAAHPSEQDTHYGDIYTAHEREAKLAENPHGRTWADAGRQQHQQQQQQQQQQRAHVAGTPREYVSQHPRGSFGAGSAASPARSTTSSRFMNEYVIDSPTGVFDRAQRWAAQRDRAVAKQMEEKQALEVAGCTFHPLRPATPSKAVNKSATAAPPDAPPSGRTPRVDTSSYYHHIQRQEGARRDRTEAQKRVDVDISQWQPRSTVPREFQFGQRNGHIASLRKPCVGGSWDESGGSGQQQQDDEDIDLDDDFSPEHTGATPPPAAHESQPQTARQARAKTPPAAVRAAAAPAAAHNSRGIRMPSAHDSAPPPQPGADAAALEKANTDIIALTRDVMFLKSRHEQQNEEIARLGGTIVSLKRELDAAKSKLRQFALAGGPPTPRSASAL
jgi:hypothetical protein